ncbi:TPA: hypothetical protein L3N15_004164 [Vibrio parahaemolyticus]|nr:hypothetical protein [Vibrio parahaemolyticus]
MDNLNNVSFLFEAKTCSNPNLNIVKALELWTLSEPQMKTATLIRSGFEELPVHDNVKRHFEKLERQGLLVPLMNDMEARLKNLGKSTSIRNRVKNSPCPSCNHHLDGAAGVGTPNPGDYSVCAYCGEFLFFGSQMELNKLSMYGFVELDLDIRKKLIAARKSLFEKVRKSK